MGQLILLSANTIRKQINRHWLSFGLTGRRRVGVTKWDLMVEKEKSDVTRRHCSDVLLSYCSKVTWHPSQLRLIEQCVRESVQFSCALLCWNGLLCCGCGLAVVSWCGAMGCVYCGRVSYWTGHHPYAERISTCVKWACGVYDLNGWCAKSTAIARQSAK